MAESDPASAPHVRLPTLLLLFAFASSLAAADGPDAAPASPQTDVRRHLLSEFKYVAPPSDPLVAAPFLSDAAIQPQSELPEPDNPDLFKMEPFTVRETVKTNLLHADLLRQRADARTAAIMTKLGVGLHVAPVGKGYLYAATIFYIPFAVGVGFAF